MNFYWREALKHVINCINVRKVFFGLNVGSEDCLLSAKTAVACKNKRSGKKHKNFLH